MNLQEHHKQFAVKSFAQFMTRSQVVNEFMEEFKHELPHAPTLRDIEAEANEIETKIDKDKYINERTQYYHSIYHEQYGEQADQKLAEDEDKISRQIVNDYNQQVQKQKDANTQKHQKAVKEHKKQLKSNLSNKLRRFNITHATFPEKYKELFLNTRKEYISSFRFPNTKIMNNVTAELETLYGFVKQRIFEVTDPKEAIINARLAHQILATIDDRIKNPPYKEYDYQPEE